MKTKLKAYLLIAVVATIYGCKKVPEVSPIYPVGTIVDLTGYEIKDASLATIGYLPLKNPLRIDTIYPPHPYWPTEYVCTDALGQRWDHMNHDYLKVHKGYVDTSIFKRKIIVPPAHN